MIDAACRGWVSLEEVKPFIAECGPWTKDINCPTFFKDEWPRLQEMVLNS